MHECKSSSILLRFALAFGVTFTCTVAPAQPPPKVPQKYQRFFSHYVDQRSIGEKALNLIGATGNDVGRSFALIAGVSHYPRLPLGLRYLRPAQADRDQLIAYLEKEEFFDEIVVLWDDDVTLDNLHFFFRDYFPDRLRGSPKARFLFAYSGHGFVDRDQGFLLRSSATSLSDKASTINLRDLRTMVDEVVRSGYQVLVLLNSCYSGAFLTNTSFGGRYLPKQPGAHVITAGSAQERSWSDSRIGRGSVFFEKVLAGLGGAADRFPDQADGVITATELYAYLRQEVQISTDQRQAPQLGDLSANQSSGEFFFLNRSRQVQAKVVPEWNPVLIVPLGGATRQDIPVEEAGWKTLTGKIPVLGESVKVQLSGTFGSDEMSVTGGTLSVEFSLSPTAARYEQVEFRTPFINRKFSGSFAPSIGKPRIPIELEINFFVVISTSHPSFEMQLLPSPDGGFHFGPFTTKDCGFSCYYIEIVGAWRAKSRDVVASGPIRIIVGDHSGVGADTVAVLDPVGFPKSVRLTGFSWHANSGGVPIPDVVFAKVADVVIKLSATYISFPGVHGVEVELNSPAIE